MRNFIFNVTLTTVTPATVVMGNAGEHNVTTLTFDMSEEILSAVDYYRLSVGDFRSEKLYARGSVVSFCLPKAVLKSGTTLLQLDGYREEEGELSLIFKSALITAEVGASVCATQDIPAELEKDAEVVIAELSNLVSKGQQLTEEISTVAQDVREAHIDVKKDRVIIDAAASIVEEKSAQVEAWAEVAASSAAAAQNIALEVQTDMQRAETAMTRAEEHSNSAKEYSDVSIVNRIEAEVHKRDAEYYAEKSENMAGYVGAALEDRYLKVDSHYFLTNEEMNWQTGDVYGFSGVPYCEFRPQSLYLGKSVNVSVAVEGNGFTESNTSNVYAYIKTKSRIDGAFVDITVGECELAYDAVTKTFRGRLELSTDNQYNTSFAWTFILVDAPIEISQIKKAALWYDESAGYFELGDKLDETNTAVAENKRKIDWLESCRKFSEDQFLEHKDRYIELSEEFWRLDGDVFDLSEKLGDIEAALDGIITLQGNLIGGGN